MKKFRYRPLFQVTPKRNSLEMCENCDSIIAEIAFVFSLCDTQMSVVEKKQLLKMLQRIEASNKCIPRSEKREMYKTVNAIWNKHRQKTR